MKPRLFIPIGALLAALASGAWGQASNTATTRSFTSEWTCSNGRTVLVNAHPRRPREVSHVTYLGNEADGAGQGGPPCQCRRQGRLAIPGQ